MPSNIIAKTSSFSPPSLMLAVSFVFWDVYSVEEVLCSWFAESFCDELVLDFVRCFFFICWYDHAIFFSFWAFFFKQAKSIQSLLKFYIVHAYSLYKRMKTWRNDQSREIFYLLDKDNNELVKNWPKRFGLGVINSKEITTKMRVSLMRPVCTDFSSWACWCNGLHQLIFKCWTSLVYLRQIPLTPGI